MPESQVPERPQRHGRRERRKHITRGDLLAAGRKLFGQKGLYESRIEDLTTEAGIAKGTLYGYFSNKDELIHAVAADGFDRLLEYVQTTTSGARSHADLIARVVRAHVDFFADNPDLMRVFHQIRGMLKFDRPEWLPLRAALLDYLKDLADVLRAPGGKGVPGLGDRQNVARILFGAVSGMTSVTAALSPGRIRPIVPDAFIRAIAAMVMTYEVECGAKPGRPVTSARPRGRGADSASSSRRTARGLPSAHNGAGARRPASDP